MAKIVIKAEGFRLSLHFPVGLCLRLAPAILKKKDEELHRFLKEHGRRCAPSSKSAANNAGNSPLSTSRPPTGRR